MEEWNYEWSHKNSGRYPWSAFSEFGAYECPHDVSPLDHGPTYDPNVHLDAQDPADNKVGLFNVVTIAPEKYNATGNNTYILKLKFNKLVGPATSHQVLIFDAAGSEIFRSP